MKLLMVVMVFMVFVTPVSAEEIVEESSINVFDSILWLARIAGFTLLGMASLRARKTIKKIGTEQFFTNVIFKGLERFADLPDATKSKINMGIQALSNLPFVKAWFDKADNMLNSRLIDIEDKIADWKVKLDSGVLEGNSLEEAQRHMEKLQAEKQRLKAELNKDEEHSS